MSKRKYDKVKRYNRSFYSGGQLAKRVLGAVAALAALFAVGWFVGPAIIDFGTHTWYTQVKNRDLAAESSAAVSQAAQSEPVTAGEPESQPAATPEPTQTPEITTGNWAFAPLSSLSSPEKITAAAEDYAAQGVQYVVVPLKDTSGYIYYASTLADASGSVAATTIDAAAVAEAFQAKGLTPVASISVFQDPIAPYTNREMGIHYQDGDYFWLDAAQNAGGKPWLNPYSDIAVNFAAGLISEVRALGYDTFLLQSVQFPTSATANCGYGSGVSAASSARLAELIAAWQTALENDGATVWFQYPLATVAAETSTPLAGRYGDLGVENLMIALPAETTDQEKQDEQLDAAYAAAAQAGTEYVVVKTGDTAAFR